MAHRAPILSGDWRTRLSDPLPKLRSVEWEDSVVYFSFGNGSNFVDCSQERIREMPGLAGPGQAGPQIGRTGPLTSLPGQETNLGRRAEGQVRSTFSNCLCSLEQSLCSNISHRPYKVQLVIFKTCIWLLHSSGSLNSEDCWKNWVLRFCAIFVDAGLLARISGRRVCRCVESIGGEVASSTSSTYSS